MSLGRFVRQLMPPSIEAVMASAYRRAFVDLDKVAAKLAEALSERSSILDIGGGDGELLNRLFRLRPDLCVTMVDVADSVGGFLKPEYLPYVERVPGTTIQQHLQRHEQKYDAAIIVDVMHHVTPRHRDEFMLSVSKALRRGGVILVKDVEPGHFRATLGFLCDRYISGDRGVALISAAQIEEMAARLLPGSEFSEIGLFKHDRPNYLVRIGVP